jgi:hypothetical protein
MTSASEWERAGRSAVLIADSSVNPLTMLYFALPLFSASGNIILYLAARVSLDLSSLSSPVRLVNGRNRCEGRVEVWHNGTWGTVCDDDWDMVDANVVCRQLDCGLAMAVGSISEYGQGSGPVLLDNVDCKGGETDLGQCGSLGWGIHNCYHYEDVSVTCKGRAHREIYKNLVYNCSNSFSIGRVFTIYKDL